MILIGHPLIDSGKFFRAKSKEDIDHSPNNSTIIIDDIVRGSDIAYFCNDNGVKYGVMVSSIKDAIIANGLNAKYIIVQKSDAKKIQNIADEYLFESRILAIIDSEDEIEELALLGIDGVIFKTLIIH